MFFMFYIYYKKEKLKRVAQLIVKQVSSKVINVERVYFVSMQK